MTTQQRTRPSVTAQTVASTALTVGVLLLPLVPASASEPEASARADVAVLQLFPPDAEPVTLRILGASGVIDDGVPTATASWYGSSTGGMAGVIATPEAPQEAQEIVPATSMGPIAGGGGIASASVEDTTARSLVLGGQIKTATMADMAPPQMLDAFHELLAAGMPPVQDAARALLEVAGPLADQDPTGSLAELVGIAETFVGATPGFAALIENSPVLVLDGVRASEEVVRASPSTLEGGAQVGVSRIELLGVISVDAFTSWATASAAGQPGQASASTRATTARVAFGQGLMAASAGPDGVAPSVPGLPDEMAAAVADVNAQLVDALDQLREGLGVSVSLAEGTTEVDESGTAAAANGSGLEIVIQPPGQAPLLRLTLAGAAVSLRGDAAPVAPQGSPAQGPPPQVGVLGSDEEPLPATGVHFPLAPLALVVPMGAWLRGRRPNGANHAM